MDVKRYSSPNFDSRGGEPPSLIVLHYTGMRTLDAALDRLRDPEAKVSCHYLIAGSGDVYQMVSEENRAWHAGSAKWGGYRAVNARSIGIELEHPGHGCSDPYSQGQSATLEALLRAVMDRWGIPAKGVVGHSDVAPTRKRDPGEWLDWQRLHEAGLGVWLKPSSSGQSLSGEKLGRLLQAMETFGYPVTGSFDAMSRAAVRAFQRRFRPLEIGRWPCSGALKQAETLAARWPAVHGGLLDSS